MYDKLIAIFKGTNLIFVLGIMFFLTGCGKKRIIYFYPSDKSQCITLIDENDIRYIIDGKHRKLPEENYIQLDTHKIDPLADAFHVCWKNEQYEWDVVVHNSRIIESKLDTSRFNFSTALQTDDRGIPNELKFRKEGCAVFSFYLMSLSPDKGAIVEIQ